MGIWQLCFRSGVDASGRGQCRYGVPLWRAGIARGMLAPEQENGGSAFVSKNSTLAQSADHFYISLSL